MTTGTSPLTVEALDGGAFRCLRLARPKANVLDAAMIGALDAAFAAAAADRHVKAVLLSSEGPHFSFGASVEEHLPGREAAMLRALHGFFRRLLATHLPVVAAVKGQCLGGGLELVALALRIVAAPDARLGQPEIALGVTAPTASVVLPERVGRAHAEDLCLTGRSVTAQEALDMGLVQEVAADPEAAAHAWLRAHLLPKSASSLRLATAAVRASFEERFAREIEAQERLYLTTLMATSDAVEGLTAFLAKRPPVWRDA